MTVIRHSKKYKIYNVGTGELIVDGYAEECAQKLNMSRSSFYSFVYRSLHSKKPKYLVKPSSNNGCKKQAARKNYSVSDLKTNRVLATGSAEKCAQTLSITIRSFYDLVSRARKGTGPYSVTIE